MIKIFFVVTAILAITMLLKNLLDRKFFFKERRMLKEDLERSQWLLNITNELLCLNISQKHWYQSLEEKGYRSVAMYGMGALGMRLSEDIILNSSMEFYYGLDINAHGISYARPVYKLDEIRNLPKPDVIVLAVYCTNDSLKNLIENEMGCEVVYIEDIINAI